MKKSIRITQLDYKDNGNTIVYRYSYDKSIAKFFNAESPFFVTYETDVRTVPQSIAIIPLLANLAPIAWFAGFDVLVDEIDEDFHHSLNEIKKEFVETYPKYTLSGKINSKKLTKNNKIDEEKSAMLFSGGVDAYATYIRQYDKNPDLITIHGADIELNDNKQWNQLKDFITSEKLLRNNKKRYIKSNLRTFYTYHVELLLKGMGWWGKIQHGLALIGSLAPLSYIENYSDLYIASSYTKDIQIAWGSTPTLDEKISWKGIKVHHDGYQLKRQDKVDLITKFSKKKGVKFNLRVCYSELRKGFNCNRCEKCFRTILGIILNGQDPNDYGFNVNEDVYDQIFKVINSGRASLGVKYFWWELMEKAKATDTPFIFKDQNKEKHEISRIQNGEIDTILKSKIHKPDIKKQRIKFVLRNRFNKIYKYYKKIKR